MGKSHGIADWTDLDYAQAAIDMLPGTVGEIVRTLRANEIKGHRSDAHHCPIARWVNRWVGSDTVTVSQSFIYPQTPLPFGQDFIRTPTNIGAFISEFDAGIVTL